MSKRLALGHTVCICNLYLRPRMHMSLLCPYCCLETLMKTLLFIGFKTLSSNFRWMRMIFNVQLMVLLRLLNDDDFRALANYKLTVEIFVWMGFSVCADAMSGRLTNMSLYCLFSLYAQFLQHSSSPKRTNCSKNCFSLISSSKETKM